MASIVETTLPYEILIRFAPTGALAGAQIQRRHRITRGDEVLKDEVLAAQPLTTADDGDLWGVLNAAQTTALLTAEEAVAERAALEARIKALTDQQEITAEAVRTARMDQLDEEVRALREALAKSEDQAGRLETALRQLDREVLIYRAAAMAEAPETSAGREVEAGTEASNAPAGKIDPA